MKNGLREFNVARPKGRINLNILPEFREFTYLVADLTSEVVLRMHIEQILDLLPAEPLNA